MILTDIKSKPLRAATLVAIVFLIATGVVLIWNMMSPDDQLGPPLLHVNELHLLGPTLLFAGILVAMMATAPDRKRLYKRLFAASTILAVGAVLMLIADQLVFLILIFIGRPAVVLVTAVVLLVGKQLATWFSEGD